MKGRFNIGTNYYHKVKNLCPHCGKSISHSEIHIGKSSAGWSFSFHGTNEIKSFKDWKQAIKKGGEIRTEYGTLISLEEFEQMVAEKVNDQNHADFSDMQWDIKDSEGHSFSYVEFS